MGITVDELLSEPFVNRTRYDKEKIVSEGKPRPLLENLTSDSRYSAGVNFGSLDDVSGKLMVVFDVASYDHVDWMTGCDVRQALFCWSCLLFRAGKDTWNTTGITDLNNLRGKISAHEKSLSHIQSMLDLQMFASKIKTTEEVPISPQQNTELIKRNREKAKRIIDVICFLVTQRKCPRIGSRDKNTLDVEDCLENLQFLRDYDILQAGLIDEITDMVQVHSEVINDMVEAINNTIKMAVLKEVHQSTFVSLILSEHSADPTKSQISTVLRYLKNGKVCERFVGFTNTDGKKSSNLIFQHIDNTITSYQISRRVIAYSFDGSVLPMQALNEVQQELHFRHPYIHFVPCHFHNLYLVLQKSLTHIKECDYFFKTLMTIGSFFQPGSNMWQEFQNYFPSKPPNLDIFRSSSYAEFLNSVKINRIMIIDFFDHLVCSNENLTESDLVKINGSRAFLTNFYTVFLLETFIKLFDLVTPLAEGFNSSTPGLCFDDSLVEGVLKSFDDEVENGTYESVWNQVARDFDELKKMEPSSSAKIATSKKYTYHKVFLDIAKCMSSQIKYRFGNSKKFSFFRILDFEKSGKCWNPEYVQSLSTAYTARHSFQHSLLEKEIALMIESKSAANCESVYDLYQLMGKSGFVVSFGNLYKLCELVLTMPCTKPFTEGSSSKLTSIDSWTYAPGKHENTRDITLLCIEQDYLKELRYKISFHSDVTYHFQEKNKTMELL